MDPPRHLILGTAGHIDHGKTSLVRALTGTDTDRLPEEKRRGITIELGFAELDLGGVAFGIVDVPGHEKFIRTMVSGATGIDLGLLVVAADDSVMPQTVEHVEILSLLGVARGVVAISKADLVDREMIELVAEEVAETLRAAGLPAWEPVAVSSLTGQGLDDLRAALRRAAAHVHRRAEAGVFRLAIDRVFTRPGRGTVVTGSVLRGQAAIGDALELLPAGLPVKVRDAQSHGREAAQVGGGQRAALNLSGVERDQIAPGDELATPGYLTPAQIIDAEVSFVSSLKTALRPLARVRFAAGTRETLGRVVPYEGTEGPRGQGAEGENAKSFGQSGGRALVQLRLAEPVVVEYGQRFILRSENAARTLGGGTVLRLGPRRMRRLFHAAADGLAVMRSGEAPDRLEQVLRLAGFERPTDLSLASAAGVPVSEIPAILNELEQASRLISPASGFAPVPVVMLEALLQRAEAWLGRFHAAHSGEPGCPLDRFVGWLEKRSARGLGRPLLERMLVKKRVRVLGRFVCLPAFAPALSAQDERMLSELVSAVTAGEFQPPGPAQVAGAIHADPRRLERLLKVATAHGALVRIDGDIYLAAETEARLRERLREMARAEEPITVASVRERLGSSRKYVVPMLEYLDRAGFTRRVGDARVLTSPSNIGQGME